MVHIAVHIAGEERRPVGGIGLAADTGLGEARHIHTDLVVDLVVGSLAAAGTAGSLEIPAAVGFEEDMRRVEEDMGSEGSRPAEENMGSESSRPAEVGIDKRHTVVRRREAAVHSLVEGDLEEILHSLAVDSRTC